MNYFKVKQENFKKGRCAEAGAKEYLVNKGYIPIRDNYKNELGEIDLVMQDNDWLIFVEVKYKEDDLLGTPEEMVNKIKLAQVRRVAQLFLVEEKIAKSFVKYRIDAVCILGKEIRHYINMV